MRTRTLAQLITDVEARADLGTLTTDSFITTATMTRWLNQSARRLASMMIESLGEDFFVASQSISVVAGTASYAVPAGYYKTRSMRASIAGTDYPIRKGSIDGFGVDNSTSWNDRRPVYRIQGNNVVFAPTPTSSYTVTHSYVPTLITYDSDTTAESDLVDTDDYVDGVNGWEEWIVLDCCIKAASAQEMDSSAWRGERDEIEADIRASAQTRSGEPDRVRDVYRRSSASVVYDD